MRLVFLSRSCLTLFLLGFASACAQGPSQLETVPEQEVAELPAGCTATLLNTDDADIHWGRAAGRDDSVVIDTPNGSCIDERIQLYATLEAQRRFDLARLISSDFEFATAMDVNIATEVASADPSPHPDRPQDVGAGDGDPSPHPDKGSSASDTDPDEGDSYTIVIVIGIVPVPGDTPPPAPTPTTPGEGD